MILLWLLGTAPADDLELILQAPVTPAPADRCDQLLCTSLVDLIDGAQRSLDLAFYGFRRQSALFDAVQRAQARGVSVRLVVDKDLEGRNYYTSTARWLAAYDARDDWLVDQRSAAQERSFRPRSRCPRPEGFLGPLQCAAYDLGDRCYLAAAASREPIRFSGHIMHHKFAISDQRHVWTGSANASDSGTGGYNANLVVRLDSPVVASWYRGEFEQMFVHGRFHGDKSRGEPRRAWIRPDEVHVSAYFSPQDRAIDTAVRPLLQGARTRIDVAVFFLTHKQITADLVAAHQRGVAVRVLLDATAARNGYTKHEILRAAGIPVKVEAWGGKMHAKSAVIDEDIVIAGSMNWTSAGTYDNDENTLVIRSVAHARRYTTWFDDLWHTVPDRWLTGAPDPESHDSGTACRDGVDNDFDGRADGADPGCSATPPPLPGLPPARIVRKAPGEACSW